MQARLFPPLPHFLSLAACISWAIFLSLLGMSRVFGPRPRSLTCLSASLSPSPFCSSHAPTTARAHTHTFPSSPPLSVCLSPSLQHTLPSLSLSRSLALSLCPASSLRKDARSLYLAAEALAAYTGETLVYVGEWHGHTGSPESLSPFGETGGPCFQQAVQEEWQEVLRMALPSWPFVRDQLAIFRRRRRPRSCCQAARAHDPLAAPAHCGPEAAPDGRVEGRSVGAEGVEEHGCEVKEAAGPAAIGLGPVSILAHGATGLSVASSHLPAVLSQVCPKTPRVCLHISERVCV